MPSFETKMKRDTNGNKTISIKRAGYRAFSIQTNGNLPNTHKTGIADIDEIAGFIRKHGTFNQQQIFFYE